MKVARSDTNTNRHKALRAFIAGCLALALPAASQAAPPKELPSLGDASSALVSPEIEDKIGRAFLQQIRATLPLSDDPILKYYTDVQLRDMTQHANMQDNIHSVVLIEQEQINAFAAPGGIVGINMGLFLHAQDVHEYSSVVAHELAHLSQRHFARGIEHQRNMTIPNLAGLVAAIALGAVGGADVGLAALQANQAIGIDKQLRYSRGREQEADRVGLNTLVEAGFDPNGMARMFDRMRQAFQFTRIPPEFLLTHPVSESRISDARGQIAALDLERDYPDSIDYQAMRARVQLHYADSPVNALSAFRKRLNNNPRDLGAAYGAAIANSAIGNHDRALDSLEPITAAQPGKLLYIATKAELLIAAGRNDEALQLLDRHLSLNPKNPALSMLRVDALVAQSRFEEAETQLERLSRSQAEDSEVWYQLAEVAGKAGNIVGVHRARAEFFAMHGALERAVQHLQYARGLADPKDFKLGARLEARIDDFRRLQRDRGA